MDQFKRMGVSGEQLQAAVAARRARLKVPQADDDFVLPSHLHDPLRLAIELRTQVRVAASPAGLLHLGLDYAARDATMRALGLPRVGAKARALLSQFRVIESEMVEILNARVAR